MSSIYLSPSLQEFHTYEGGGNEEQYMNLLADAMIPYLRATGIEFARNDPYMTLSQVIEQSNASNCSLHLALHSNAAPPHMSGQLQGPDVYYYATSSEGQRAAQIIASNLESVYPVPDLVAAIPTSTLTELRQVSAPAVFVRIAYHDTPEDADWIRDSLDVIARNLVLSLADYFGLPFVDNSLEN